MAFSRSQGQLLFWIVLTVIVTILVSAGPVLYSWWRAKNTARASIQIAGSGDLGTLAAIVKSPLVIKTALRRPGIQALNVIRNQPDPEAWLMRNLVVSADDHTRVVHLSLQTDFDADTEETRLLVNAIVDAGREQLPRLSRQPVHLRLTK